MSAVQNKQLMQEVFAEIAKGNSRPFIDSLAEDVRWIITGTTVWSRTYEGKRAVLDELLTPLRAQLANQTTVSAHRFIAEGDYVVVEARGHNTTKAGVPYNNTYCWVCRLSDGKVQELIEYWDSQLAATVLGDPRAT